MFHKVEMVYINGHELEKVIVEKDLTRSSICYALGQSSSLISNCIHRNKMRKDIFYDFCALVGEKPERFLADSRFADIMEDKEPVKPVPKEEPFETAYGKILNSQMPKKEKKMNEVKIVTVPADSIILPKQSSKNYEKCWAELKQYIADAFVRSDEVTVKEIVYKIVELEGKY